MMKKFLLAILAAFMMIGGAAVDANAQNEFYPPSIGLNFGLGCGTVNHSINQWNNIFVPSFEFAGDYSFLPNIINVNGSISGGLYFGIGSGSRKEFNSHYQKDVKYTDFCWRGGTRGALHYSWVRNLDTYAGIAIGVKHQSFKADISEIHDETKTDLDYFGFAGVRYKLTHGFSFYSEVASSHQAWFQIGVSVLINN